MTYYSWYSLINTTAGQQEKLDCPLWLLAEKDMPCGSVPDSKLSLYSHIFLFSNIIYSFQVLLRIKWLHAQGSIHPTLMMGMLRAIPALGNMRCSSLLEAQFEGVTPHFSQLVHVG